MDGRMGAAMVDLVGASLGLYSSYRAGEEDTL